MAKTAEDLDQVDVSEIAKRVEGMSIDITRHEAQPEVLYRLPNRHTETDYMISLQTSEFTTLSPLHLQQPEHATIAINYIPDKWVVESTSLKLYFISFRGAPVFHEEICPAILETLVALLEPKEMLVEGVFSARGGLQTTITARYPAVT